MILSQCILTLFSSFFALATAIALLLLLVIVSNHAFPAEHYPNIIISKPSHLTRREEYDPYGINSILSRFYKRSRLFHWEPEAHPFLMGDDK